MGHASKERVLLIGTDQRITSGPAATTAALKGRIHGCTRTLREKVRFFSLAPRAPSIHDPQETCPTLNCCCANERRMLFREKRFPGFIDGITSREAVLACVAGSSATTRKT